MISVNIKWAYSIIFVKITRTSHKIILEKSRNFAIKIRINKLLRADKLLIVGRNKRKWKQKKKQQTNKRNEVTGSNLVIPRGCFAGKPKKFSNL